MAEECVRAAERERDEARAEVERLKRQYTEVAAALGVADTPEGSGIWIVAEHSAVVARARELGSLEGEILDVELLLEERDSFRDERDDARAEVERERAAVVEYVRGLAERCLAEIVFEDPPQDLAMLADAIEAGVHREGE